MARNTPISVVRSLTEPIMVRNTTRTSMPTTMPTIARLKPLNSFTACIRLCTASRTVVTSAPGSAGRELAHDLVDGGARVGGRDLDERELAGPAEQLLDGRQVGDEQVVVLSPGRSQDAGEREALAADAHVVAHLQAEHLGRLGAGHELVAVARRPPGVDRPPALELELGGGVDAHEQGAVALDLHRADELRRDHGDARARRDGAHALEVGAGSGSATPTLTPPTSMPP